MTQYSTSFLVDQTPEVVFAAITNPRRWWSEEIEGDTDKLNAVFYYHYQDVHRCTFKITECSPAKKVVWHVLHNHFSFVKDRTEWNDTDVVFEIGRKGEKTEVRFTHVGLIPAYECFDICTDAWGKYIKQSLQSLVTTGSGQPNPKMGVAPGHEEIITRVRELSQAA